MEKKILFLVNPKAGLRKSAKNLSDILKIFCDGGLVPTVLITDKPGDGIKYIVKYGAQHDIIACTGGDGTFNQTVAGIMAANLSETPIGYIPSGSTNDFAKSLKLSSDMKTAAFDIVNGDTRTLDVGLFNRRFFTYVASFGAFTRASYTTSQNAKNTLGHLAYVLEGIKDIPSIQTEHITLTTKEGDVFEDDYIFGAISNSVSLGGVLTLNENIVDMNDGLFEIMLVKSPKNMFELQTILTAVATKEFDCSMIDFIKTSNVVLNLRNDTHWSLDGEYYSGSKTIRIADIRSAIRIFVPKQQ